MDTQTDGWPDCCCSSSHHSGHFSQPVCAFVHLFSVCRVLSQALDTQGQTRQNRFLLNFLANFSMMTYPWSSARIYGWADTTLVVMTLTKPNCCCFLWGARLVGLWLPSKLLLGDAVQPCNYVGLEKEERSPKEWLSLGPKSKGSVEMWVWAMIPCRP